MACVQSCSAARMVKRLVADLDFEVDIALTGQDAIEKANQCEYDLIFMNIGLPDIDGITVTESIRARGKNNDVRIVALSGHLTFAEEEKCLDCGMIELLIKPFKVEDAKRLLS